MSEWKAIEDCPYQTVVEVRNEMMERPCRATRGYMTELGMHPNNTFFTSVYTPDGFFSVPAGQLVCPTEYRLLPEEDSNA